MAKAGTLHIHLEDSDEPVIASLGDARTAGVALWLNGIGNGPVLSGSPDCLRALADTIREWLSDVEDGQ